MPVAYRVSKAMISCSSLMVTIARASFGSEERFGDFGNREQPAAALLVERIGVLMRSQRKDIRRPGGEISKCDLHHVLRIVYALRRQIPRCQCLTQDRGIHRRGRYGEHVH